MVVSPPQVFTVGQEAFFGFNSPNGALGYGVVFEDDESTGYFYAIDRASGEMDILDALHIYNVDSVPDRETAREAEFIWTEDGLKAALFINGYCHALFDFRQQAGFCRNGFPAPSKKWAQETDRNLSDEMVNSFLAA